MARKAKVAAKPAPTRKRRTSTDPGASRGIDADTLSLCARGKHPSTRKIGRGCAACGRLDAWPSG